MFNLNDLEFDSDFDATTEHSDIDVIDLRTTEEIISDSEDYFYDDSGDQVFGLDEAFLPCEEHPHPLSFSPEFICGYVVESNFRVRCCNCDQELQQMWSFISDENIMIHELSTRFYCGICVIACILNGDWEPCNAHEDYRIYYYQPRPIVRIKRAINN